jgi:hypothetical protein
MDKAHAEAVVALGSSLTYSHRAGLGDLEREHRLPSVLLSDAGGLLSYMPNIKSISANAPVTSTRILPICPSRSRPELI